jgi:hypothetical protein
MLDWIKSTFKCKAPSEPSFHKNKDSEKSEETKMPLYFVDVDEKGFLFARYVHVTSSIHMDSIKENGLRPLENAEKKLLAYLEYVFPNEDSGALLNEIVNCNNQAAINCSLVKTRLEEDEDGKSVVAFLPLGEKHYLASAVENSQLDGGEFFKAARTTVNTLRQTNVEPPYPNATAVICIVRHYIVQNGLIFSIKGTKTEEFEIDFVSGLKSKFKSYWGPYAQAMPLHVNNSYPPQHIINMELDTYLTYPLEPISPKAIKEIIKYFPLDIKV